MISSMTGFASVEREIPGGILLAELRSVNHRYLELQMKLDEGLRSFEPLVREHISALLGRGKVECRMSVVTTDSGNLEPAQLNAEVLQQLKCLTTEVHRHLPDSRPLSVAEILRWPGVLQEEAAGDVDMEVEVREAIDQLLGQMKASRQREGAKLKTIILERLAEMRVLVDQVKPLLPLQLQAYQDRLTAKLHDALGSVDDERIRQELVLYAQRIDVDEELGRLTAHMQEVARILDAGGPAGKRLDFLMQELNREANTLGSKSVSTEVSQTAMGLKIRIEQMREQIQNIE